MISFDYLHGDRRSIVHMLRAWRPAAHLRVPLTALVCSGAIIMAAWGIEAFRLHEALRVERAATARFERQQGILRRSKVYARRVQRLIGLDRRIRGIADSGTKTASRLAAIASALPRNVWLTQITPESNDLMLEGRTANLAALGGALRGLARDAAVKPTLTSAQAVENTRPSLALRFTLHLEQASH